jgi:hypothetical protein
MAEILIATDMNDVVRRIAVVRHGNVRSALMRADCWQRCCNFCVTGGIVWLSINMRTAFACEAGLDLRAALKLGIGRHGKEM